MARVYVYIDGHNLYNDLTRRLGGRAKWLDLEELSDQVAGQRVEKVRYFTSRVVALGGDEGPVIRQRVYLAAVRQMKRVCKTEGFMKKEPKPFFRYRRMPWQRSTVRVWSAKEKGSDVNLASYLLLDAFENRFDTAYVMANDSDYATPIRIAAQDLGKDVRIIYPAKDPARQLVRLGVPIEQLWESTILKSQIATDTVSTRKGRATRPTTWPR